MGDALLIGLKKAEVREMKKETRRERLQRLYDEEQEEIRKMIFEDPQTISDVQFQRREKELLLGPIDE